MESTNETGAEPELASDRPEPRPPRTLRRIEVLRFEFRTDIVVVQTLTFEFFLIG